MTTLKMYFVCVGKPDWITSYGVLSNGFCFGQHICSHWDFAPGDLYFHRKNRIDALREMFGIDPETVTWELIKVLKKEDVPEWWDEQTKLQEGLKPLYELYQNIIKSEKLRTESEKGE